MVAAKAKAIGLDTLVQNISVGYVIVFLIVLTLVLLKSKTLKARIVGGVALTFLFAIVPYWLLIHKSPAQKQQEIEQAEYVAKYEVAKPIFDKLCAEQSKPIIKRTVEDVEGVLLLKVRPESNHTDWQDQMWAGAGLDALPAGNLYIKYFLYDRKLDDQYTNKIRSSIGVTSRRGFKFVDVRKLETGEITRVTAKMLLIGNGPATEVELIEEALKRPSVQYAVDIVDNVDPELRKHWIAGTTIKIIDTSNNDLIAQRTWWNWDTGFGSTAGFRSPWLTSNQRCPAEGYPVESAHKFIDTVLIAKQGN